LLKDQRRRFGHPVSIEGFLRVDNGIRRNPVTGEAGYFVNEVSCAPEAYIFDRNHVYETFIILAKAFHQSFQEILDHRVIVEQNI
jgi:hypothetical protein